MSNSLFHITSMTEWKSRNEEFFTPNDFSQEGFIHLSTSIQLISTANQIFKDREHLFVLEVEPQGLEKHIVFEKIDGGSESFPHLYRPLPLENIVQEFILQKDEKGFFKWDSEHNL